jgi:HPt (histidine-containing phosphotransfer) domain-containing protein
VSAVLDGAAAARLQRVGGARLLRGMIELFLEHGPARLAAAEVGMARADWREVERAWHSLKSSAANLGAAPLAEAAARAEAAAAAGNGEAAATAAAEARAAYPAAADALRALLEELTGAQDRGH